MGQMSSRLLDREVKDRFYLIIAAQESGTPSPRQQGFCNITVTVDDENDNNPRIM